MSVTRHGGFLRTLTQGQVFELRAAARGAELVEDVVVPFILSLETQLTTKVSKDEVCYDFKNTPVPTAIHPRAEIHVQINDCILEVTNCIVAALVQLVLTLCYT